MQISQSGSAPALRYFFFPFVFFVSSWFIPLRDLRVSVVSFPLNYF